MIISTVCFIIGSMCPSSWMKYKNNCYMASTMAQGITWLEAERQCTSENAHLVSIMDGDEMQVVHYLIYTALGTKEAKTYIGK